MKDGLRVFDSDTHVEPTAEVIDQYVDPAFRSRLPEYQGWSWVVSA